jgi:hypothetical protein
LGKKLRYLAKILDGCRIYWHPLNPCTAFPEPANLLEYRMTLASAHVGPVVAIEIAMI